MRTDWWTRSPQGCSSTFHRFHDISKLLFGRWEVEVNNHLNLV